MKSKSIGVLGAIGLLAAAPTLAQSFPEKPIRMVIPFPAGGPTDILGRLIGEEMARSLKQNVVIDNRPGGSGALGASYAAKSPPDGYTIYLGGVSSLVVAPLMQTKLPYDAVKDFQPVTLTTLSPLLLMVHPSVPVKTVKDFIAFAKARPGQLSYATSGPSGTGVISGELFKMVTGTQLTHVPYRGAPPALIDLMAGHVPSMFGTMLAAVPHIRTGKIRALAVTGPRRSVALPDVPTFAESGMPNYEASAWNGYAVPAGTPRPIVDRLSSEIARIVKMPSVLDRLVLDGPIPVGNTPDEFAAFIKAEFEKWGRVIRAANIKGE